MSDQESPVCKVCGQIHTDSDKGMKRNLLGSKATQAEIKAMELIRNKLSCAQQALTATAIPAGSTEEQTNAFVAGVIKSIADIQMLHDLWWTGVIQKYNLPSQSFLDFSDGSFYTLEHE